MMEKDKESEFPEGRGGLESASRILMTRGSPLKLVSLFNAYALLRIDLIHAFHPSSNIIHAQTSP
jgi:hypothetical protein